MPGEPKYKTDPAQAMTVLSVSPAVEDHLALQAIFNHSKRVLYKADCVASALAAVRRWEIGVVLCERALEPGAWTDLLEGLRFVPDAPPLIVTSRVADEALWAEALNRGAFDVLPKPFEIAELVRSVNAAWVQWRRRREAYSRTWTSVRAAS